jgi:hypothetical protein
MMSQPNDNLSETHMCSGSLHLMTVSAATLLGQALAPGVLPLVENGTGQQLWIQIP